MKPELLLEQKIAEDRKLAHKWGYLVESIKSIPNIPAPDRASMVVARLLENQERMMSILENTTSSADVAQFKKYAYPMIRRIYPTIAINDLVSMQPLDGPVGQIFTFQAKYGSTKGGITAGQTVADNVSQYYSSRIVDQELLQAAGASTTAYAGTLSWKPVVADSVTVTIGAVTGTDDGAGNISGTGITAGTIDYTSGAISITLAAADTAAAVVTYKYNSEGNTQIPEITFEITSRAVQAEDRVLRAKWTIQSLQDMMAVHGVEGDKVFTEEIAAEIQREISFDVIEQLRAVAANTGVTFSKTRPVEISYEDHKRQLIDQFTIVSNNIYRATRRGFGNVMVVGSDASNIIRTLPTFRPDSQEAMQRPNGRIGVLNNQWVIVHDINFPVDKVMIGFKGNRFIDAGAVFSPYALTLTDALLNPDDMQIRKGLLSRDAFTITDANHYEVMTITA